MKHHLLLILLFSGLFAACNTSTSPTEKNGIDSIQLYKSIIHGSWYEPGYIAEIQKTKSPYKSRDFLADIVELEIDTSKIQDNSIFVGAPSIHEGTSFHVILEPGLIARSHPISLTDYQNKANFYELSYEIGKDTSLYILHYDENEKLIEQTKYSRAPRNSAESLQYMVNKTLFAGSYTSIDSMGKSQNVQLNNDGSMTGFGKFKDYYVLTDFIVDIENNLDQICFDIQTPNQKCYGYVIENETISLHETLQDSTQTLRLGERKFLLLRRKSESDFSGVFEYKSTEKSENHYIVIERSDSILLGTYYGCQSEGEHGIFFYKAVMEGLRANDKGEIEFEIGERRLYEKSQFNIQDTTPNATIGRDSFVLKYQGRMDGNKLKLKCTSEDGGCWDNEFAFDKLSEVH